MLWLILHISHLRDGGLHAEGHLILGDTVFQFQVTTLSKLSLMKIAQPVEHQAPAFGALAFRVIEVEHRVLFRTEAHPIMLARQETTTPEAGLQRLAALALGNEHHKRRQVLIERAKAIIEPRAHRGSSRELGTGL